MELRLPEEEAMPMSAGGACGLTVELNGAHADVGAWHFILHASAPAIC